MAQLTGTTLSGMVLKAGTEPVAGYAADALTVVKCSPTAAWADDLVTGITTHADQDGTLKAGAVDEAAVLANNVVTTAKILDANVTAPKIVGIDKSVLTTDSNPYKFSVYLNTLGSSAASSVPTKVLLDTEAFDTNNNFDPITNRRYTAPVAGFYQFNAQVICFVINTILVQSLIYKNGALYRSGVSQQNNTGGNNFTYSCVSALVPLVAGDYIELWCTTNAAGTQTIQSSESTFLEGFLVSRT